jgi:hypothetical protein
MVCGYEQFVTNATKIGGDGPESMWDLEIRASHAGTGEPLQYDFTVAANGTILAMMNVSAAGQAVAPLRQWRRVTPFH